MAEKEEKKKEEGPKSIADIVNSIIPSGHKDPDKRFSENYEAMKKHLHPNFQKHIDKLSFKLFDSLYQSSMDGITRHFGDDVAGAVNNEDKLTDLAIEYITDFLKVYEPKILKGPVAKMKDKKARLRVLASHYDRAVGLDDEHSIALVVAGFKDNKKANVGDLIGYFTEITKGGRDQRNAHFNLMKQTIRRHATNTYVIPHLDQYINKVMEASKETVDKDAEISDEERADFITQAMKKPYMAVDKHLEVLNYHVRKPTSGPGDEMGYKKKKTSK